MYKPRKLVIDIDKLVKKYGLKSEYELARKAGIEQARLNEVGRGKRKRLEISYITRIAEALDIDDIGEIMHLERLEEEQESTE